MQNTSINTGLTIKRANYTPHKRTQIHLRNVEKQNKKEKDDKLEGRLIDVLRRLIDY